MYNDYLSQPRRSETNPSSFAPSSAVAEPFLVARATQPAVQVSNTMLILMPFSLLALWTIALLYFDQRTKRKNTSLQQSGEHKLLKQVPCRRCLFFKNNPYLKCAIHPIDALPLFGHSKQMKR